MAELAAMATPGTLPADSAAHLARLRAQPRRLGEASFFWVETQWRTVAVKVLPGEYFVSSEALPLLTTLGSCIATCLWDRVARVGGMNHFMLPEGGCDNGRYGAFAMDQLIHQLLERGATPATLQAKVFGGGQVLGGMDGLKVGERNTSFVLDYLRSRRIPVVGQDVLGVCPRKLRFMPSSGQALVRRLSSAHGAQRVDDGRAAGSVGWY